MATESYPFTETWVDLTELPFSDPHVLPQICRWVSKRWNQIGKSPAIDWHSLFPGLFKDYGADPDGPADDDFISEEHWSIDAGRCIHFCWILLSQAAVAYRSAGADVWRWDDLSEPGLQPYTLPADFFALAGPGIFGFGENFSEFDRWHHTITHLRQIIEDLSLQYSYTLALTVSGGTNYRFDKDIQTTTQYLPECTLWQLWHNPSSTLGGAQRFRFWEGTNELTLTHRWDYEYLTMGKKRCMVFAKRVSDPSTYPNVYINFNSLAIEAGAWDGYPLPPGWSIPGRYVWSWHYAFDNQITPASGWIDDGVILTNWGRASAVAPYFRDAPKTAFLWPSGFPWVTGSEVGSAYSTLDPYKATAGYKFSLSDTDRKIIRWAEGEYGMDINANVYGVREWQQWMGVTTLLADSYGLRDWLDVNKPVSRSVREYTIAHSGTWGGGGVGINLRLHARHDGDGHSVKTSQTTLSGGGITPKTMTLTGNTVSGSEDLSISYSGTPITLTLTVDLKNTEGEMGPVTTELAETTVRLGSWRGKDICLAIARDYDRTAPTVNWDVDLVQDPVRDPVDLTLVDLETNWLKAEGWLEFL